MDTSATKNNSAPARCSGCGEAETSDRPIRWLLESDMLPEFPDDLYCDKCYRDFRQNYEEAEEALIAAIKAAKLHEVYTIEHIQAAAESLFGCTTEAVTMSRFAPAGKRGSAA